MNSKREITQNPPSGANGLVYYPILRAPPGLTPPKLLRERKHLTTCKTCNKIISTDIPCIKLNCDDCNKSVHANCQICYQQFKSYELASIDNFGKKPIPLDWKIRQQERCTKCFYLVESDCVLCKQPCNVDPMRIILNKAYCQQCVSLKILINNPKSIDVLGVLCNSHEQFPLTEKFLMCIEFVEIIEIILKTKQKRTYNRIITKILPAMNILQRYVEKYTGKISLSAWEDLSVSYFYQYLPYPNFSSSNGPTHGPGSGASCNKTYIINGAYLVDAKAKFVF